MRGRRRCDAQKYRLAANHRKILIDIQHRNLRNSSFREIANQHGTALGVARRGNDDAADF